MMFFRKGAALSRRRSRLSAWRADANFRARGQGYFPQPAGQRNDSDSKRIIASRGGRPYQAANKRRYTAFILSGILLSLVGAGLILHSVIAGIDRRQGEAELKAIYYEAVSTEEASVLETAAPEATQAPQFAETAAAPNPRTFITPRPGIPRFTGERFLSLQGMNKDIIGWLTIKDVLDLPVAYRDNLYYLTHDFRGNYSTSGTLFLDENIDVYPPNENLVIHGHNMRDGSMFGQLQKYADRAFYIKHCLIQFETLYEQGDYAVFAVLNVSTDVSDPSYFQFIYGGFETDVQFDAYIDLLKKRSLFRSDIHIAPTDALLTLSTCKNGSDDYFVVVARKVRDDENPDGVRMLLISSIMPN